MAFFSAISNGIVKSSISEGETFNIYFDLSERDYISTGYYIYELVGSEGFTKGDLVNVSFNNGVNSLRSGFSSTDLNNGIRYGYSNSFTATQDSVQEPDKTITLNLKHSGNLTQILASTSIVLKDDDFYGQAIPGKITTATKSLNNRGLIISAPLLAGDPDGDAKEPDYKYQWYLNGSPIAGALNRDYVISDGNGAYKVGITYKDSAGNISTVKTPEKSVYNFVNQNGTDELDQITANPWSVIRGGKGDDQITGSSEGVSFLVGGEGNDTYSIKFGGVSIIIEKANISYDTSVDSIIFPLGGKSSSSIWNGLIDDRHYFIASGTSYVLIPNMSTVGATGEAGGIEKLKFPNYATSSFGAYNGILALSGGVKKYSWDEFLGFSPISKLGLDSAELEQAIQLLYVDDGIAKAPTDLALTSTGVNENSAAGTLIGTLAPTDPDANSTFTYELVAGDGSNDADNSLVEIVGNEVKVKSGASIDFETNPILNLNIQVTDNGTPGLTYTKAVTAAVLNVNDAPTVNAILPLQTINRGSNFSYSLPPNLFLDQDSTPTLSATTTTGGSLPSWLTFNASTGIFTGTPSSSGTVALNIFASDGLTSVSTPLELKIREVQSISSLSKPITYQRNKDLIVPINYSTTDGSKNTGISFNVYFDSSLLSFDATTGIANKVQADLFNVGAIQADTANSDGDGSTDKFIAISLASFSGNLLSNTTPTKLADLTFKVADKSIDPITGLRNTNINFTEIEAAQGYGFSSISASLTPFSFNLDVDGDGKVTALGDGLMVIRKLFGAAFTGDALTNKAISPTATRNTAQIHDFIQQGIDSGLLDVDKDRRTTALGDGLMLIRRLFGAAFSGSALTDKAISPDSTHLNGSSYNLMTTDQKISISGFIGGNIDALRPSSSIF